MIRRSTAFLLFGTFLTVSSPAEAQQSRIATVVRPADVAATLDGTSSTRVSDRQIRMVDAGGHNVGVGVVRRPEVANQTAISHDELTEVYYVLEGSGTLVTGGEIVDARRMDPTSTVYRELTGPSSTGSSVQGGQGQRITAGDVVIIPAGSPHWFSDVEGDLKYLVVRVDPGQILPLK